MPPIVEPFLAELDQEAQTTRRVLERIPDEKLSWKPHEKSMSIGQLALHTASSPGAVCGMLAIDNVQLDPARMSAEVPQPANCAEILDAHEKSVAAAKEFLGGLTEERSNGTWRLMAGDHEVVAMPRSVAVRGIILNHWYHHRGQLSVYLRLLNVPVPVIYGRSADEDPFAQRARAGD